MDLRTGLIAGEEYHLCKRKSGRKYGITVNMIGRYGDRLFDNLDPDKLYPLYGDGSNYLERSVEK
jgi:hypothetical protein